MNSENNEKKGVKKFIRPIKAGLPYRENYVMSPLDYKFYRAVWIPDLLARNEYTVILDYRGENELWIDNRYVDILWKKSIEDNVVYRKRLTKQNVVQDRVFEMYRRWVKKNGEDIVEKAKPKRVGEYIICKSCSQ